MLWRPQVKVAADFPTLVAVVLRRLLQLSECLFHPAVFFKHQEPHGVELKPGVATEFRAAGDEVAEHAHGLVFQYLVRRDIVEFLRDQEGGQGHVALHL